MKFGQGAIGVVAKKRRILRMLGMGTQIRYQRMSMGKDAGQSNNVSLPGLKDVESQIAIPLLVKDKLIGVFAVESNDRSTFNAVDEVILNVVANQIATAIDNATTYKTQRMLTEAYSKFVPKQFLELLNQESILETQLNDQTQCIYTILFSDIRNFTSLSEKMSPQENFEFINRYLSYQAPVIEKHNGFIDKYIGDAIMAIFPSSPCDAVSAAKEMLEKLNEFNDHQTFDGKSEIGIGIGIHTGAIMLGVVGSEDRMEGTVIGDTVYVASRIEGLTKKFGCNIVASASTVNCLDENMKSMFTSLGMVSVKGKDSEIKAYKLG